MRQVPVPVTMGCPEGLRPIRFAGGVGGHLPVVAVAAAAQRLRVERLVSAHLGRPTLRAMAAGLEPAFGELARDRQVYWVRTAAARRHRRRS